MERLRPHELRALASKAAATRAGQTSAERVLEDIEHRVALPAGPQGDPNRVPTGGPRLGERFLSVAAVHLHMDFGAVVVVLDGYYLGPVLCSRPMRRMNDFHFVFGEGPAIEAGVSGNFVEVRDLRTATWRWPAFAPAALEAGVRSAWCIPLPHPDRPGLVLTFAGRDPIPYDLARYNRLTRVTRIAQALLVDHPGTITAQTIARRIEASVGERAVVHQASGILSERMSIECESA